MYFLCTYPTGRLVQCVAFLNGLGTAPPSKQSEE